MPSYKKEYHLASVEITIPTHFQTSTSNHAYIGNLNANNIDVVTDNEITVITKKYYSAAGSLCEKTTIMDLGNEHISSNLHCTDILN